MDDRVKIREARQDDAGSVADLSGQLGYPATGVEMLHRLEALRDSPDDLVLVAEDDAGTLVGWIHAFETRRIESDAFVELGGLVVDQKWRGRGIGSALLAEAERWAADRGRNTIRLRSRIERIDAHRLYERSGWLRSKTQHVFVKDLRPEG